MRPCNWSCWGTTDHVQETMLDKLNDLVEAGVSWTDIKVTQQMLKAESDNREDIKWQASFVWPAETERQLELARDTDGYAFDLNKHPRKG